MRAGKIRFCDFIFLLTLMVLYLSVIVVAQGKYSYVVSQGGAQVQVGPMQNVLSAVDYYDYDAAEFQSANPIFRESDAIVIFLYEDTTTEMLSLFMLVGAASGAGGGAQVSISGVPAEATFLVKDDEFDFFDVWKLTPPTASVS